MGKTNTPPKYLANALNDVGKKFGKLTVIEITDKRSKDRKIIVKCICDCGNESFVRLSTLRVGNQISCGCVQAKVAQDNGRKAVPIMIERGKWTEDPKIGTAKRIYKNTYRDGDLSFDEFLELSQRECFYCGVKQANCCNFYVDSGRIENKYSEFRLVNGYFKYNGLDRVDNSRGHYKDNVVPCCCTCNMAKRTMPQQDFIDWIKRVYNHLHCKE